LDRISERVATVSGSTLIFEVKKLGEPELSQVLEAFREQSYKEYEEIIEECTTSFHKEIEFERLRRNFTYEEAEEIYSDLEKLKSWLGRVSARDWFGCGRRQEAERHIAECEKAYEEFERECFAASELDTPGQEAAQPGRRPPGRQPVGQSPLPVWRSGGRRPARRRSPH
jgi:hypothetical protein